MLQHRIHALKTPLDQFQLGSHHLQVHVEHQIPQRGNLCSNEGRIHLQIEPLKALQYPNMTFNTLFLEIPYVSNSHLLFLMG
jgi:hypothetical protein